MACPPDDRSTPPGRAAPALGLAGAGVTYADGTVGLHLTDLDFEDGALCVLLGLSGAGKSTLLRLLNLLVRPTGGAVRAGPLGTLDPDAGATLRAHRRATAMIFQQHHLIGRLAALQNVPQSRLGRHPPLADALGLP
jgi:phosphonate transport system ATP-binding protein